MSTQDSAKPLELVRLTTVTAELFHKLKIWFDVPDLFELVLDGVGGRQISAAVAKVAPGGTVVLIGASDPEPAQLSLLDFAGHENATLRSYFSYAQPDTVDGDLASLVRLLAEHRLTPHIGLRSSWIHTNAALDTFAAGRVDGKAVLDVHT